MNRYCQPVAECSRSGDAAHRCHAVVKAPCDLLRPVSRSFPVSRETRINPYPAAHAALNRTRERRMTGSDTSMPGRRDGFT